MIVQANIKFHSPNLVRGLPEFVKMSDTLTVYVNQQDASELEMVCITNKWEVSFKPVLASSVATIEHVIKGAIETGGMEHHNAGGVTR